MLALVPVREKWERVTRSHAVNIDAIDHRAWCCVAPTTAEERDGMTSCDETSEDLMEMELCTARLRVLTILPIQYQNAH